MMPTPKPTPKRERSPPFSNRASWLLVPLLVLLGLIGGVIGGELGPIAIDGGRFSFPSRFLLIYAAIGAVIGVPIGLLGGILAVVFGRSLSGRTAGLVTRCLVAAAVLFFAALSAAGVVGGLYLASLSSC
jgi:hypothetical protein